MNELMNLSITQSHIQPTNPSIIGFYIMTTSHYKMSSKCESGAITTGM